MVQYVAIVVDKEKAVGTERMDLTSQEQGSALADCYRRPSRSGGEGQTISDLLVAHHNKKHTGG